MLNEVPKRVRTKLNLPDTDEGIDLIAETAGKKYWAIQAKFRSDPDSRLTNKGDLATFTALAFHTCKNIDYGLICATTSQPLKKVKPCLSGCNPHPLYVGCLRHTAGKGVRVEIDVLKRDDSPFPASLLELQRLFPVNAACAVNLKKA